MFPARLLSRWTPHWQPRWTMKQKTMTRQPPNFAEPPQAPRAVNRPHPDAPSDALSDVLHAIHLRGGTVSRHTTATFTEATHPRGTRLLHIVERGDVDLRTNGSPEPIALGVGDLVLLARGDAHTLRAGEEGSWVTGTFVVEEAVADPFLAVLPAALVIHGSRDDDDWLPLSLALLVAEVQHPRPGSQVMVSRILDLLFIHALRVWAARGDTAPGWLTAAMDPALGPVLTAIHRNPAHD